MGNEQYIIIYIISTLILLVLVELNKETVTYDLRFYAIDMKN